MRLHSITILGLIATAAGWAWLIFGVGMTVESGIFTQTVVNSHLLTMAQQLCMLGYATTIVGVLLSGFDSLTASSQPAALEAPRGEDDPAGWETSQP